MAFPLRERIVISDAPGHLKRGVGIATDYRARYVRLYMPFDGSIDRLYDEWTGGKWLDIVDPDGNRLQFAHIERYLVRQGDYVLQGTPIAVTGATGRTRDGQVYAPHLHIQIINRDGNRIDPETYDWEKWDMNGRKVIQTIYAAVYNRPTDDGDEPAVTNRAKRFDTEIASGKSYENAVRDLFNDIVGNSPEFRDKNKGIFGPYADVTFK